MSTRSLIGGETEKGTILVYVHSDGYPDGHWGKIATLQRLVATHGIDRVMTTLLQSPSGWSSFDGAPDAELRQGYRDGRFETVPGFGVRYTMDDGNGYCQGNTEYATPADFVQPDAWWDVAYIYVVSADGKTVRWAENTSVPWDEKPWTTAPLAPEMMGAGQ